MNYCKKKREMICAAVLSVFISACGGLKTKMPEMKSSAEASEKSAAGEAVRLKFSEEIRQRYPNIWEVYKKYENKYTLDCTEKEGEYSCDVIENLRIFYDTNTGSFGVKMRLE